MPLMLLVLLLFASAAAAQPTNFALRLPPPGIALPEDARADLAARLKTLQTEITGLDRLPKSGNLTGPLDLPDIEIYEKAVRYALLHNEFFRTNDFGAASRLLAEGSKRVQAVREGRLPWQSATGLVVRGYRSRLDNSAQPYGLVVPAGYKPGDGKRYRLDIWLHGRDETLTELKFIQERSSKPGEFTPPDTFVLHPYGRYCNAFKFAGEVDVLEALEEVERAYPIDPARVALRGFSMGGAGVWHLAAHHADKWVCAAPGAGFAETAEYLHLKRETVPPYERALWQWYDATDYALNLFNCPVIAYSGELDKQRQAADMMGAAMAREALPLVHLIGPKTEHRYESETKRLLASMVDTLALRGRPAVPREVRLTTRTLRYPKMDWLLLLGLEKHWERADAWAVQEKGIVSVSVTNVTSFGLTFADGPEMREINVNGAKITLPHPSKVAVLARTNGTWALGDFPAGKRKAPDIQGPIDDAFMDSFVFVTPSAAGFHPETDAWTRKELDRAVAEWRAQFRGDVRVVRDVDVNESEIKGSNLILWGDPKSNAMIGKVLGKLPIEWTADRLGMGAGSWSAKTHVPLMIYPNPLNPENYVVINSGFTFRGFGSNAGQTPKLPDYAALDTTQSDPFATGVAAAGFFNERWEFGKK